MKTITAVLVACFIMSSCSNNQTTLSDNEKSKAKTNRPDIKLESKNNNLIVLKNSDSSKDKKIVGYFEKIPLEKSDFYIQFVSEPLSIAIYKVDQQKNLLKHWQFKNDKLYHCQSL